jgi:hypothetical protein
MDGWMDGWIARHSSARLDANDDDFDFDDDDDDDEDETYDRGSMPRAIAPRVGGEGDDESDDDERGDVARGAGGGRRTTTSVRGRRARERDGGDV